MVQRRAGEFGTDIQEDVGPSVGGTRKHRTGLDGGGRLPVATPGGSSWKETTQRENEGNRVL